MTLASCADFAAGPSAALRMKRENSPAEMKPLESSSSVFQSDCSFSSGIAFSLILSSLRTIAANSW